MKPLRFKFKLKYLAILALAVILLGNRGFRSLVRNYREYRRLRSEKTQLELQRVDLEKKLAEISRKPAIEQAARKELGLIKPDETEYRFPPPKESDK
ncbi:MAG: septum formation initiator family protein [Elusimicrobia bacterium]|nr:septum formation initiator family protein [Elusimicrobiota bacterium]